MTDKKIPVIICVGANGRGVVYGYADKMPESGDKVTLTNARMILRFGTVGGLFGLAAKGPTDDLRLTAVIEQTSAVVQQALQVSTHAARLLDVAESFR
jgi:hypothetical protein